MQSDILLSIPFERAVCESCRGEIPRTGFSFYRTALALAGVCLSLPMPAQAQNTNEVSSIRLAPSIVTDKSASLHDVASESDRVGPAKQPEWTTRRVFAETDIYVIPPGEIEFNQFYTPIVPRSGQMHHPFETELELGRPWRTQVDMEQNYNATGGKLHHDSSLVEIPHALADWGEIPFNPAIEAGWRFNNDEANACMFKLLLAEEFNPRLHFGANLGFGRQVGDEHETAYEFNVALSYVVKDSKLAVGVEALVEHESWHGGDDDDGPTHSTTVMVGPSVLYKPTRNTHVGLVTLFGLTNDSPVMQAYVIFGIDFEPFSGGRTAREGDGKDASLFQPVHRPR